MDIYLDHAATTPLDPEVLNSMLPYMAHFCGNPSSVHRYGCRAKAAVEKARKKIATLFGVAPSEIFFTSGGTEGNNMLLRGVIEAMQIAHVLTSPLEHLSVRMPLEILARQGKINLSYVQVDQSGGFMLDEIEEWLKDHPHALVSFMRVNHEIGNITDVVAIGALCKAYEACFHSDTIQSIYCGLADFQSCHLALGSAHKIHGPKGIGFVYIDAKASVAPLITGGSQELNMRGGTENVAYIVGMAKALEMAFEHKTQVVAHLLAIKQYMIGLLKTDMPDVTFNGQSASLTQSSPNLLNISLPDWDGRDMVVYHLDIHGIAVSAGSACTSGSAIGSSVLSALQKGDNHAIRFSFSKNTTFSEVEKTVDLLRQLYTK
ncbi:cysteine desulfurase family protein [Cardinium endosymbiont of Bemisia tabaci]|uniref:cysteine desulfurase family protein n=1 Tax=Cardinium endosymbiont of Bemisia tabaci TaxID=672794 RepID=UPI000442D34D|nr:cysteine desulfurase family protein [Cardinium endosymbiont of Bemisia tabaci]CDG49709.1 Cysteine desulfurase [Cardinium endosymbiont cBtQ1 of Bemisia tabaci]